MLESMVNLWTKYQFSLLNISCNIATEGTELLND